MKTLVLGSINIDLIFSVDHIVRGGETIASSAFKRSAGGKGANQAAALAKAGLETHLAGKIGADGAFLRALLESYGVDTRLTLEGAEATGQALIQLDARGQNAIVLYAGGNGALTRAEVDAALAQLRADDVLVLQNEIPHTGYVLEQAAARTLPAGVRIALNPSPYNECIHDMCLEAARQDAVSMLFVNEIEGAALAELAPDCPRPQVLEKLTARFPACEIILTAGKEGAYYGFGKVREYAPVVQAPVVDTTGAGDTFLGYFIAARARGLDAAASLTAACKAASLAVSRPGAMEAIPTAPEVFEG